MARKKRQIKKSLLWCNTCRRVFWVDIQRGFPVCPYEDCHGGCLHVVDDLGFLAGLVYENAPCLDREDVQQINDMETVLPDMSILGKGWAHAR